MTRTRVTLCGLDVDHVVRHGRIRRREGVDLSSVPRIDEQRNRQ